MWKRLRDRGLQLEPPVPFSGNDFLGCQQIDVPLDNEQFAMKKELIQRLLKKEPDTQEAG